MTNYVVELNKVTKKYYLEKPRELKKWFSSIFQPYTKFTVIDNLTLKIKKGDFVLIVGTNGCGKTTLLKLVAGITFPDMGTIKAQGKVVPLIELGSGFNFELSGRENIVIYASILGIKKKDIITFMPKIIEYSGLKSFIDVPIKRYSSGMISRLAFSIAIYSNPDILLLDEIFAVGDEEFVKKSINKLNDFQKKGMTVIVCSHFNITGIKFSRKIELLHTKKKTK